MNHAGQIRKLLEDKKRLLKKALNNTKAIRDDALSATQSWSDTTRNESENMVIALEEKIKQINDLISLVDEKQNNNESWEVFESEVNKEKINVLLVPTGFGGMKVGKYTLVSEDSPLGIRLSRNRADRHFNMR